MRFEKKYNDADVALWKKMYIEDKMSTPEIGRKLGLCHSTINVRLIKEGIKLRNHSEANNCRPTNTFTSWNRGYRKYADKAELWKKMYLDEKKSMTQIEKESGIDGSAIYKILIEHGVKLRSRKEARA